MLATFVIGLREGLEAALIVGIVAAFLRRNGRPLLAMWLGVAAAVGLSAAVGITLALVEASLPQAAQEGLETVIGAVAVVFVTGMVLWMGRHARGLKRELEASAQQALGTGTSRALVGMAFLAVLKEGFETAVFLLATFKAATNAATAAAGAMLGILAAVVLGAAIASGGARVNLSRFFRTTGVFLVLVAAGLVVSALRTAHEAGWLDAGQQATVNLAWLAPPGSVQGSLFTGVLGVPADIRLVEVVGWVCYLVPMLAIVVWPPTHRPGALAGVRIRQTLAASAGVAAVLLAVLVPAPRLAAPVNTGLVAAAGSPAGTAALTDGGSRLTVRSPAGATTVVALQQVAVAEHRGLTARHLIGTEAADGDRFPASLTLADVVALNGRVPIGVDVQRNPGPYAARWSQASSFDVWTVDGALLDAAARRTVVVTLSGGGLPTPRTLSVAAGVRLPGSAAVVPGSWTVDPRQADQVARAAAALDRGRTDARFWGRAVPVVLLLVAAALVVLARRRRRALGVPSVTAAERPATDVSNPRSNVHAH